MYVIITDANLATFKLMLVLDRWSNLWLGFWLGLGKVGPVPCSRYQHQSILQ